MQKNNLNEVAMLIIHQKLSSDIFTVGNLQIIFKEHALLNILMIFGIKEKMYNFDPYNVLLTIATNIPVLLMTSFVLQGHKYNSREEKMTAISVSRRFLMVYLLDQQKPSCSPANLINADCLNEFLFL